jgi:hypothetical protein
MGIHEHDDHAHGRGDDHGRGHGGRRAGAGLGGLVRLVLLGLLVTAVVRELRLPAEERTWHGTVAGVVPYDLRKPTVARFKERLWNPESERLIGPHVFGVGWSPNVGRIVALARQRVAEA